MGYFALFVGVSLISIWLWRRNEQKFNQENNDRQELGLPPLTRSQFRLKVFPKSDEFKKNINQHM